MCKDIKLLDTAKTNLSNSIDIIDKYSNLMRQLDDLSDFCGSRNYLGATHCHGEVVKLLEFFKPYREKKDVNEMFEHLEDIKKKSRLQIKDDFNLYLKGESQLEAQTLQQACTMVEVLGTRFRNEIMLMPVEMILMPYRKEYEQK